MLNTSLHFEKQDDVIKSTLVKKIYVDPWDLIKCYYNLPILTSTHPKLETSIQKLNNEIIDLGISEELTKISKCYHPLSASEEYFYFDLQDDHKSLRLVKKLV